MKSSDHRNRHRNPRQTEFGVGAVLKSKLKKATFMVIGLNFVLVVTLFVLEVSRRDASAQKQEANCLKQVEREHNRVKEGYFKRYCFRTNVEKECRERGYVLKPTNNGTVCCGNLNERVYSLVSENIQERLQADAVKESALNLVKRYIGQLRRDPSSTKERPAAHVGILQDANVTDSGVPRIRWETSGERSFVSGGVLHGGDRLTVTKSGFYYVYTGLQFTVTPNADKEYTPLVSFLYRHVNGTRASQQKMMSSRESSCRTTRGDHVTGPVSMYMAGIFMLRAWDQISVRTGSQHLLHRSSATTYMGLHMV